LKIEVATLTGAQAAVRRFADRPVSTTEGGCGMAQQFMGKLNANERMAFYGALIVFVLSLIGTSWFTLILSAAVIVVYYLKYSPSSNMTWPIQVQLIQVVLSGIIGLLALLGLIGLIIGGSILGGFGGFGLFGGIFLVVAVLAIVNAIGAFMMVRGTWREYQGMPNAAPPASPAPPAPPAA
jgi:hypothetical protein